MVKKLKLLVERHDSLLSKLNSDTLESKELGNVSKEIAALSTPKSLFEEWQKNNEDLGQLQDILTGQEQTDKEMLELAKEEYAEVTSRIESIERELISELAPKDSADEASAILEIRAGAGGDEAALFSAEMARMYERFAQLQKWKWEVLSRSEDAGLKGIKVSWAFLATY